MMRIRFSTRLAAVAAALLAATAGRAQAQDAVINGKVTGEQGRPLAGATVFLPQLNAGSNTNANGNYSITIPASRVNGQQIVMTARFIGYQPGRKTVTISAGTQTQDFALERDVIQLNEVVVTGTADAVEQKKLAFSVGVVNSDALKDVPGTDPVSALSGKVAGAQVLSSSGTPGKAPSVRLRSATSISGSQEPLIIVDGTITRLSLADINSEDIERMEVIKGAAASSLYGSDAANGVIQIFTKRGANLPEDKMAITVRNEYGQSSLPKQIPVSLASDFLIDTVNGVVQFARDANGNRIEKADRIADIPYPQVFNHQKEALRSGAFWTNYISLGQRKGATNYNASFQNTREEGILFGIEGYRRQNFRLNVDQQVNNRLTLQMGGFFGRSTNGTTTEGPGSPFFSLTFVEPNIDLYAKNPDGSPYRAKIPDKISNAANPLYALANISNQTERNRYTANGKANYRIFDWLVAEGNYNFDGQTETYTSITPKGFLNSSGQAGPGQLQKQSVTGRSINTGATLTSTRTFGVLTNTTKASAVYEGLDMDSLNLVSNAFSVLRTPEFGATVPGTLQPYSTNTPIRNQNYFLISTFDIKDRYIFDGLIRNDQSSLFGANQRSHNYYRVSGAYRVTEDFKLPGIDEFRLRASRGTAGLRPIFTAQYETYSTGGGLPGKAIQGNPDLKPAQSAETEVGFNLDFLTRFGFEYTYSKKKTSDQILLVPLSAARGFTDQWQNAGTLEGKTHEAALRALLADAHDFTWRLNVTGDRTRQKITQLNVAPYFVGPYYGGGNNDNTTKIFKIAPGETFGVIYGAKTVRSIDQLYDDPAKAALSGTGQKWSRDSVMVNEEGYVVRKSQWRTKDETPIKYVDKSGSAIVKIGDVNPDFNMAFNSQMSWKNFNVNALVNWVHGGNIYNGTRQWPFFEARDRIYDQRSKPVEARKSINYYGYFYNSIDAIDFFVEDGSYIKLKELAVNYTVPRAFMGRFRMGGLETAKIGVVGRNLWTHTKYSGYDPEVAGLSGDPYSFRFDGFSYPNFRTFTGVIELGF